MVVCLLENPILDYIRAWATIYDPFCWTCNIKYAIQKGHDGPGSLTWAKIGNESDDFSGIRNAD